MRRIDDGTQTITYYPTRERAQRAINMMLDDDDDYGAEIVNVFDAGAPTTYAVRIVSLIDGAFLAYL